MVRVGARTSLCPDGQRDAANALTSAAGMFSGDDHGPVKSRIGTDWLRISERNQRAGDWIGADGGPTGVDQTIGALNDSRAAMARTNLKYELTSGHGW